MFLLLCALLLAGCSMLRVAYNNGESLSYWWINSYIDIQSEQRQLVKDRLARLFEWHRATQLKDYVQVLGQGQRRLQQNPDKSMLEADFTQLRQRARVLLEQALPDMADLALSLKPAQIANIEKKFVSQNEEYRKKYLRGDPEQRQRYRFDKTLERAEYWFGEFTREQEAAIRKAVEAVPLDNELYLAARQRRQRDLSNLLNRIQNERPTREKVMQLLKVYTTNVLETPGGAEFDAFFDAYNDGMTGVAVIVINIATPAQKARASLKLQQLMDDFSQMIVSTSN